jgi:Arc/MetJ-type ribon-helix-helix transcriptional regulator
MYEEPKMEKLTINLPPVELARIDILVEAGYYPSRTEFIRAAIRSTLDKQQDFVSQKVDEITSESEKELTDEKLGFGIFGLGVYTLDKEFFERVIDKGKKGKIQVVGMLKLEEDVTPEHIEKAVASVKVYGVLKASPKVKEALQEKMKRNLTG